MRRVIILKPVDGYAPGDTPEVFGPRGREMIAAGQAEWAPDEGAAPKRKRKAKAD